MRKKVAINGFGRIGRAAARIILKDFSDQLDLVAVNDPSDPKLTAHLLKYDTNFGTLDGEVKIEGDYLFVAGEKIRKFQTRNISDLPWGELDVDIVLECTGVFRTKELCQPHLDQGAKKVLLSAPCKSEGFRTIVLGVNDEELQDTDTLVSNASCTTNCLAPVVKVLHENFGIEKGMMTTVHSYTNDQRILDVGHKDLRRARAAAENMIPTTTGAAKAVGMVYPEMQGKIDGMAIRVPTPTVSVTDFVATLKKETTTEEVNAALKAASEKMPHVLGFETAPLVSSDYMGDSRSSIVDAAVTKVTGGNLVKVLAWYDNEWGYSCRLVELATKM
ncbi:type I glyceraldehyde-3-phosphate dehydrogenase [bacterium DOLZORAL124_38_8]|nr:MAG: type I glyceraldehyde-3-phosphate dehydrogenase [bacterium DOLZORAL124_38_8]